MLIDPMHLQHRFCQIDPNRRNLHDDAPSQKWLAYNSTLASRCRLRKGASIPLDMTLTPRSFQIRTRRWLEGELCRPSHICIFNMSEFGGFASSGRNLLPSSQAWRLAPRLSSGRNDDGRRYPPGIAIDWRRRRVVGQGCVWFAARSYAAIRSRDSCCSWTRREEFTGHARRKRRGSAIHQGQGPPEHHQRSAQDHSSPVNGFGQSPTMKSDCV